MGEGDGKVDEGEMGQVCGKRRFDFGGEQQYVDVLLNSAFKTYMILLTNAASINLIKINIKNKLQKTFKNLKSKC